MTERTCDDCGVVFMPTHGLNRYCESHRSKRAAKLREYHDVTCVECGKGFRSARKTGKLCSDDCRASHYASEGYGPQKRVSQLPAAHPVRKMMATQAIERREQMKSPLRRAIESADHDQIICSIKARTKLVRGCWIWQGRIRDGYPEVRVGQRTVAVHRLTLEAKWRRPLGNQAAHHVCAVTACVNPDHLQPVTARENTAEMLARTYMVQRIADLEAALLAANPSHPLLAEIGIVA